MITEDTIRQNISTISDQHHTMTGAVIAVSAAQAAALGEACMQISLDNQVDTLNWQDVTSRIEQMARLKDDLLEWSNQDGKAIIERIALRRPDSDIGSQRFWFESAAEISRLSIDAAQLLQDFRPLAFKDVQDDLEITINLLIGTAESATLLLASNLNLWPETTLCDEYEQVLAEVKNQIEQLKS
jgi:formiminotetrahydrofolate cyclodeaminase